MYALEGERLRLSRDGGRSWQVLLERPGWIATSITADATAPDTLYAAGPGLLERSDDGGRTWRALPGALPGSDIRFIVASPTDAGVLFIHLASGAFYQSDDSGATWMPRDSLPGEASTVAVAQRVCCQETLYAAVPGSGAGAWVGSSDGRLWQRIQDSPQAINAVALNAEGRLIVGTDAGVYATADRGKSWKRSRCAGPSPHWRRRLRTPARSSPSTAMGVSTAAVTVERAGSQPQAASNTWPGPAARYASIASAAISRAK